VGPVVGSDVGVAVGDVVGFAERSVAGVGEDPGDAAHAAIRSAEVTRLASRCIFPPRAYDARREIVLRAARLPDPDPPRGAVLGIPQEVGEPWLAEIARTMSRLIAAGTGSGVVVARASGA
jgi:hypothetical protein